jgi:ADP-ribosylglycohydrolase
VVGALVSDPMAAIQATVLHTIITHYHPRCVLATVLHSLLIQHSVFSEDTPTTAPTFEDIQALYEGPWRQFKEQVTDSVCLKWLVEQEFGRPGGKLEVGEQQLLAQIKGKLLKTDLP